MKNYFRKIQNQVDGPFSLDELRYLFQQGKLQPEHQLREGETGNWKSVRSHPNIYRNKRGGSVDQIKSSQQTLAVARRRPQQEEHVKQETLTSPSPVSLNSMEVEEEFPQHKKSNRNLLIALSAIFVSIVILLILLFLYILNSGAGGMGDSTGGGGGGEGGGAKGSQTSGDKGGANKAQNQSRTSPPAAEFKGNSSPKTSSGTSGTNSTTPPNKGLISGGDPSSPFVVGTAKFFGIQANGPTFVYVVDCSGSMSGLRFEATKKELKKSINKLSTKQNFYVIFFSTTDFPMFTFDKVATRPLPATDTNVNKVSAWIDNFSTRGGTAPESALLRALSLNPDSIFMMTDGVFDASVVNTIKRSNTKNITIHTIAFKGREGESIMKQIAKENSGEYRYVP